MNFYLSYNLSIVFLINFSLFHPVPQSHCVNFNWNWCKASLGEGDSIVKGINNFKKKFSRTTWLITCTTKFGTKHFWVIGIQVCINESHVHFNKKVKIYWWLLPCENPVWLNFLLWKKHWLKMEYLVFMSDCWFFLNKAQYFKNDILFFILI